MRRLALSGGAVRGRRSGMALIVVMVAVGLAVALAVSLTRSQITAVQIQENAAHRDAALAAAHAGAAAGIATVQSPEWEGVETGLEQIVASTSAGTSRYEVAFHPRQSSSLEHVLEMVVRSRGIWEATGSSQQRTERAVEITLRLVPRIGARSDGISDQTPQRGDYAEIQRYAIFAHGMSDSLKLDPRSRINGNVWARRDLDLFAQPKWNEQIREQVLDEIGVLLTVQQTPQQTSGGNGNSQNNGRENGNSQQPAAPEFRFPHPLAGELFHHGLSKGDQERLQRIAVPTSRLNGNFRLPRIEADDYTRYRLFDGGFEYEAERLSGTLRNKTLRPSPDNPLGIFVCDGSLTLDDDVEVIGTLAVKHKLTLRGRNVVLTSFSWRNSGDAWEVDGAGAFPRLPAILAERVFVAEQARVHIGGALFCEEIDCRGRTLDREDSTSEVTGFATAQPVAQPLSQVTTGSSTSQSQLPDGVPFEVWFDEGISTGPYSVQFRNATADRWDAIGELAFSAALPFRLKARRVRSVHIAGPVAAEEVDLGGAPEWDLSDSQWNSLYLLWQQSNVEAKDRAAAEGEPEPEDVPFITFLEAFGLSLEPTVTVTGGPDTEYLIAPPLFTAWQDSNGKDERAGYVWEVLEWREVHGRRQVAQ